MILLDLARRAVTAAASELGKVISRKLFPADDDELGQPLPYSAIEHQRAQERAAISHKVPPK